MRTVEKLSVSILRPLSFMLKLRRDQPARQESRIWGIDSAENTRMAAMHSLSKGQREVVNDLVRKVLLCDMGSFTAERFKNWVKSLDNQFRKMGMTLQFEIRDRTVNFAVKELRTGRRIYHFSSSTRVRFDGDDVIMTYEEITRRS
jgi:hypothetical protein